MIRLMVAISVAVLNSTSSGTGERVLITEIMYNPDSTEQRGETEWVELANVGDAVVQIKNWRLDDEDSADWGAFDCTLKPGEVIVLVNQRLLDEKEFWKAWMPPDAEEGAAPPCRVFPVKWGGLANSADAENEILQLLNADDEVVCEVNYQSKGAWPRCNRPDGLSIWLNDLTATDLNKPAIWSASANGEAGCWQCTKTDVFNGEDIGSPGFVPGLSRNQPAGTNKPVAENGTGADEPNEESDEGDDDNLIDY